MTIVLLILLVLVLGGFFGGGQSVRGYGGGYALPGIGAVLVILLVLYLLHVI